MTIDSATMFRRRADALYRNIGGEGVVVRQSAGEVLVLNESGARVLDLLDSGLSVHALLEALAAEYEVDASTLERDIGAYVQELLTAGIIEETKAQPVK